MHAYAIVVIMSEQSALQPFAPTRTHELIAAREPAAVEAVREWLRVPSFSDTGEGIDACAAYTRDLLATIAPDAAVVPTEGHPVVLGTVPAKAPGAPTLLVYGLYDVTPTVPGEWTTDPLAAEILGAEEIGVLPHLGEVLVGRGANNHKGPVLASILAVRALLDSTGDVPANLVYVIEGEEEIGSPSLPGFVRRHHGLLSRASGIWLPCMQQNSAGTMTLRRAFKGAFWAELECRGGAWGGPRDGRHLWAGNSAWIDAPLMRLVKALGCLYDDRQRVTLDGLEEAIDFPVGPEDPDVRRLERAFAENPSWEANMLHNLHVDTYLDGGRLSDHLAYAMLGVTLNVQGITGGYQGPSYYTMMPGRASAKVDFRFPPGISVEDFLGLLRAHLDRRGYGMVDVTGPRGYPGSASLADADNTLLQAARRTADEHGIPVDVWPIANNCCPASLFTALGADLPFSVAGAGHGDRAHAPDEYITVGSVRALMDWTVDYLASWAALS